MCKGGEKGGEKSGEKGGANLDCGVIVNVDIIDVGQGEATLISILKGADVTTVLIDGGLMSGGGGAIVNHTARLNIASIDIVVLTHYDSDHMGGLRYLMKKTTLLNNSTFFDHGRYFSKVNGVDDYQNLVLKKTSGDEQRWPTMNLQSNDNRNQATQGILGRDLLSYVPNKDFGSVSLTCVAVNGFVLNGRDNDQFGVVDPNNKSIGLILKVGDFTYFTAGDLEDRFEEVVKRRVIDPEHKGHLCCYKAGHHGANTSGEVIFNDLKPTTALISCGGMSQFEHPGVETVPRMELNVKHNYYMTGNGYAGDEIPVFGKKQTGKARIGGDDNNPGTIRLTVVEDDAWGSNHQFTVSYWDMLLRRAQTLLHRCGEEGALSIPGNPGGADFLPGLHIAQCVKTSSSSVSSCTSHAIMNNIFSVSNAAVAAPAPAPAPVADPPAVNRSKRKAVENEDFEIHLHEFSPLAKRPREDRQSQEVEESSEEDDDGDV